MLLYINKGIAFKEGLAVAARIHIFTGHFGSGKTEIAVNYALSLARQGKKTIIVDCDIVKLNKIYPLSAEFLQFVSKYDELYFFEEVVSRGSVSELLGAMLAKKSYKGKYISYTISDEFVAHSTVNATLCKYHLDTGSMIEILNKNEYIKANT